MSLVQPEIEDELRVVELGNNVAASYCGRLFSQDGAEVIRIDTSDAFDRDLDIYLNTDKRRVSLDLSQSKAKDLLSDLVAQCDVFVCDLMPAELDRLEWLSLGPDNSRTVLVSVTPFGLTGPRRDWVGWGPLLLAMGGYTALIGDPGREPLSLPGHFVEYLSGQYAYVGASAELLANDGRRHVVEVSMLETVLSLSQFTTVMWTCNREVRTRHGNAWSNLHPIAMYPCKDGWFLVNVVPGFWPAFARMLGDESLETHPDFATNAARLANREKLDQLIVARLSGYTMEELMEMGQRQFRVPTGGALTFDDLLGSAHLEARGFFRNVDIDGVTVRVPRTAFHFVGEKAVTETGVYQPSTAGEDDDARSA